MSKHHDLDVLASEPMEILATLVPSKDFGNPQVQSAMKDELNKWLVYDAFEEVMDESEKTIDIRWIVNKQEQHDGLKVDMKARLCLRGVQEDEKPRSDSPTVNRTSTRILYFVCYCRQ